MWRFWRGVGLGIGLSVLVLGCTERPGEVRAVVLVLADTLRADYLGSGGFEGPISPRLDQLAREGLVFERCYSQAPWTKPSVATLFTGLFPEQHGVITHRGWFGADREVARGGPASATTDVLPEEAFTLAEGFQAAGFHTAAIVANPWIRRAQGFAQGFETFVELDTKDGAAVVSATRRWLDGHAGDGPFFLYLHLMDVHGPYDAPEEDGASLRASPSLGAARALEEREWRKLPEHLASSPGAETPAARDQRFWRERYAAGVRVLDRHVGELCDELAARGLRDSSLLVFTADHGEELLERGGFDHGHALFAEQLHVPLLARLPGAVEAGTRRSELTSLVELPARLFTWANLEVPPAFAHAPTEVSIGSAVKWHPDTLALRDGAFLLLHEKLEGEARWRLFDVAADPKELRDIAAETPEVLRTLQRRLAVHGAELERGPHLQPGALTISPELARELGELGY
jgi:arylsulfatase A-like enzyme